MHVCDLKEHPPSIDLSLAGASEREEEGSSICVSFLHFSAVYRTAKSGSWYYSRTPKFVSRSACGQHAIVAEFLIY